jgi:hypothetical protein
MLDVRHRFFVRCAHYPLARPKRIALHMDLRFGGMAAIASRPRMGCAAGVNPSSMLGSMPRPTQCQVLQGLPAMLIPLQPGARG